MLLLLNDAIILKMKPMHSPVGSQPHGWILPYLQGIQVMQWYWTPYVLRPVRHINRAEYTGVIEINVLVHSAEL